MATTYVVIMAGGAGTRFWPASRESRPKQLLALADDPSETLLSATARRIRPLVPDERIYIATGARLLEATRRAVPAVPAAQVLAEPVARNTAPCIGWATATIVRRDPEAIVAVLPSDHFVGDEPAFCATLERALEAARAGYLTTIGVVPTRPETGYGYIEAGAQIQDGIFRASRFVEKPDRERAIQYVEGGKHLWNAGMFFFRARVMLDAIAACLPELASGLQALDRAAARGAEAQELMRVFPAMPSISIDHGVMERSSAIAVVPGSFGWNDVGSWQSAWELAEHDQHDNALPAGAIAIDASGNLVCDLTAGSPKRTYALVGVSDLVLVETEDCVLVIPRERAQEVRAVIDALKASGRTHLL